MQHDICQNNALNLIFHQREGVRVRKHVGERSRESVTGAPGGMYSTGA